MEGISREEQEWANERPKAFAPPPRRKPTKTSIAIALAVAALWLGVLCASMWLATQTIVLP